MAMQKQTTDRKGQEQEGERQQSRRTRGSLEPDCAVVVPTSSATIFHRHPSIGVVRQNIGFSEMEVIAATSDTEPTYNYTKVVQLHETPTQSTVCISTIASTALSRTVECSPTAGLTASSVERNGLEGEVRMLQMEDEPDEYGDT